MDPNIREERRRIFRQELFTLKEEGYLSDAIVETVAKAHQQYQVDLIELEEAEVHATKIVPSQKPEPPKPQKVKKTLTPEEVRERNITWSLNLGVIFLLIGGLFVATSNWESMTSPMKSGSIAIVALLFYGIAFLSKRILHIDKTAFAFIVLGSLFLPIFILSLGWFGLLGPYLSITGEGRYFLGMLGSFLPIIIYVLFAKNLGSRLFVWFSYVSLSVGAAFLLAGIHLKIDYFYLGMIVFNVLLILGYHRIKSWQSVQLFTKEFVPYIQINLVFSTLFMLFLYDNEVLYSFNLLLTAIIYLAMMYVSGRKEYHFIFSVMIVYGVYQLVNNSFLDSFGEIIYALIGFGMVFVPKAMDGKFTLDKVFQYTSAVISGFAFFYISFEGILLRAGKPSIVLLLAYFILAANFIYLSHHTKRRMFPYLGSVFIGSGIYEAVALLTKPFEKMNFSLALFLTGFVLISLFGVFLKSKYLKIMQTAARDVGMAIMALAILTGIAFFLWWELGVMLFLLAAATYLVYKKETRMAVREMAAWILPSSLGLSLVAFGEEINGKYPYYQDEYGYAFNFAAGAVFVLLSSFVWRKAGEKNIEIIALYTSQALYTIAICHALVSPINQLWGQPLVLAAGVGMYYYLYKKIGTKWVPFLVSTTTFLSYFSIINAISQEFTFSQLITSLIASTSAVFLLIIALFCRKQDLILTDAFAWTGHIIYPLALLLTWLVYPADAMYSFIIAVLVYSISTKLVGSEWKIKAYLYGSFTSLFFVVISGLDQLFVHYNGRYEFPVTSGLIFIFSTLASRKYKERTAFYFVPFSIIGMGSMLFSYPFEWLPYLVTCVYTLATLFYLHKIKWGIIGIVPLFIAFLATIEFSIFTQIDEAGKMLLAGGIGLLMTLLGHIFYKSLFEFGPRFQDITMDGYTVVSFLYFGLMYFFVSPQIWSHALPGVLIAATLWLQRKRVPSRFSVLMVILAGAYLLQPYFAIIDRLNIPSLWDREVRVLPFIIFIIFIRRSLKGRYSDITKAVQWGVLIIVSLLLIQDGLASNTIYDAIIIGSLSLLSMMAGMFLQIKSYFFVGAGVLLLNVFLQTRPYWGNMPWWVYLLIAGLILITVASFNEWHKQKVQKRESTFIIVLKEKIIDKIKKWD